jgi:hypothetical protein
MNVMATVHVRLSLNFHEIASLPCRLPNFFNLHVHVHNIMRVCSIGKPGNAHVASTECSLMRHFSPAMAGLAYRKWRESADKSKETDTILQRNGLSHNTSYSSLLYNVHV